MPTRRNVKQVTLRKDKAEELQQIGRAVVTEPGTPLSIPRVIYMLLEDYQQRQGQ